MNRINAHKGSTMRKSPVSVSKKGSQDGAVLIISLVMLTILTIIALGTATDIGLQSNMARNSQISLRAFNVSLSELQAQAQSSVNNEALTDGKRYLQVLSDVFQQNGEKNLVTADLKMPSGDNPFTQEFVVSFVREGVCGGGNQIGNTGLIFEMESSSKLDNTGINSNQTFGVCFPNPNAN